MMVLGVWGRPRSASDAILMGGGAKPHLLDRSPWPLAHPDSQHDRFPTPFILYYIYIYIYIYMYMYIYIYINKNV